MQENEIPITQLPRRNRDSENALKRRESREAPSGLRRSISKHLTTGTKVGKDARTPLARESSQIRIFYEDTHSEMEDYETGKE